MIPTNIYETEYYKDAVASKSKREPGETFVKVRDRVNEFQEAMSLANVLYAHAVMYGGNLSHSNANLIITICKNGLEAFNYANQAVKYSQERASNKEDETGVSDKQRFMSVGNSLERIKTTIKSKEKQMKPK